VVVADIQKAAADETTSLIRAAGGEATPIAADVSVEADAKAMVDLAIATYGRIDVLYNNAGIMPEATTRSWTPRWRPGIRSWRSTSAASTWPASTPSRTWSSAIPARSSTSRASSPSLLLRAAGRVHRVEGCGPGPDSVACRPVRAAWRPNERHPARAGRNAAPDGLACSRTRRPRTCVWPETRPAASASRTKSSRWRLSRLRRISLDERRFARHRRRDQRQLLLEPLGPTPLMNSRRVNGD